MNIENIEKVISRAKERNCKILENEPMSKHTTFKIGGNATALITVESIADLSDLYSLCNKLEVPCFVIGNGSNLLINDNGYEGIVFRLSGDFNNITLLEDNVIKCGAGITLARLCKIACENSLTGLEFAWGIPGTVGGAVYMNAGAYNEEMEMVVDNIAYVSPDGQVGTKSASELKFSYRHSVFSDEPGIVTSVTFRLKRGKKDKIEAKMADLIGRRQSKQPLEYPSAGSIFKRPKYNYAGTLIEECGLKGKRIGGAEVSEKHAGFIINKGGATCKDVCDLIEFIQETVKKEKGILLECEVKKI